MPASEPNILAVAIAIERRFFAPLNINSTPSYTLFDGVSIFFNIVIPFNNYMLIVYISAFVCKNFIDYFYLFT